MVLIISKSLCCLPGVNVIKHFRESLFRNYSSKRLMTRNSTLPLISLKLLLKYLWIQTFLLDYYADDMKTIKKNGSRKEILRIPKLGFFHTFNSILKTLFWCSFKHCSNIFFTKENKFLLKKVWKNRESSAAKK